MTPKAAAMTDDYSQTYHRQWVVFFLLVASCAAYFWYQTYGYHAQPVLPPAAQAQVPEMNWFYLLRMPEVQIHSDVRSSREQFSKWLDALQKEGFHFVLLSEVLGRLNQGVALPEKTAVIVFDPGFRRTADTFLPILSAKHIPAVWLTNGGGIARKDKRYISRHLVDVMQASGLWDLGFYNQGTPTSLQTRGHDALVLGERSPWKPDAGRYALNRWVPGEPLDHLNVNSKWTAEDLVHRLQVERPVEGSTLLSLQQIQGRNWGIGLDVASTHDTRFTLRAPVDKRSGSLYWLGTLGLNDVHLRVEVKSLVGEMHILLRSDPLAGQAVSIVFARGKVAVEQTLNGKTETLGSALCPDIAPNTPFSAVLAVMGRRLALAVNDHPLIALDRLSLPDSKRSMIRLIVQDSLKGVGEAKSVRILCTPLSHKNS